MYRAVEGNDREGGAIREGSSPVRSWMWYPAREAPEEDVKGLSRLKGHLQKGQWVTKFRKILRKDEMTDDLELVPVPAGQGTGVREDHADQSPVASERSERAEP